MQHNQHIVAIVSLALVAALIGGVALVNLGSQPGQASVTLDSDVPTSTIAGSSPDGNISEIPVSASGSVAWEDLDSPATDVRVTLLTPYDRGGFDALAEETHNASGTAGSVDFGEMSGELLANSDYSADDFSADEDGVTRNETFQAAVQVEVITEDGDELRSETHTFTVSVTNEAEPDDGDAGNGNGNGDAGNGNGNGDGSDDDTATPTEPTVDVSATFDGEVVMADDE